jgi:hypothetical protein
VIGGFLFALTYHQSHSLLLTCLEHALFGNFLFTASAILSTTAPAASHLAPPTNRKCPLEWTYLLASRHHRNLLPCTRVL